MKNATFNVNNVNKRLRNLLEWLKAAEPDVACLQELKTNDDDFPKAAIEEAGYCSAWRGQRSWNGVAILARDTEPVVRISSSTARSLIARSRLGVPGENAGSIPTASHCRIVRKLS